MSGKKTVTELALGEEAIVDRYVEEGTESLRLMEMGILPGTRLKLMRRAPLGDPLEIEIRGYHLSLRKNEALQIEVRAI